VVITGPHETRKPAFVPTCTGGTTSNRLGRHHTKRDDRTIVAAFKSEMDNLGGWVLAASAIGSVGCGNIEKRN
jgi:hypothetical protein